jgi:hypothetical protein
MTFGSHRFSAKLVGSCSLVVLSACAGRVDPMPLAAGGSAGSESPAGQASSAGSAPFGTGGTVMPSPPPPPSGTAGASSATGGAYGGIAGGAGTGSGSSGGLSGYPLCTVETKGAACSEEGLVCLKTCGPQSVGSKTEVCTAGVTVEGACEFDCSDTSINWGCFANLGTAPECPAGTQAAMPCTVPACEPCAGAYLNSAGVPKIGGCICVGASGAEKWSCAVATAWPSCE